MRWFARSINCWKSRRNQITRKFRQSDKILDSTSINNGKVDGDKISFATHLSDGARVTHKGTIHANEIMLTVVSGAEGSDISEITLKRSK